MKCLGVNPTANCMWLACADEEQLLTAGPTSLALPSGLEGGDQLRALRSECERVLRDMAPDCLVVLDPEATARFKFAQVRDRVTCETLLGLAAAEMNVPYERLSRAALRSRLGLGRAGSLVSLVANVIEVPLAPHWTGKRDLAALAAIAGGK